jgi:hypothetical protein
MKTLFTNLVCVTCLAGLAALQFSWFFWPWLAMVVAFANLIFMLALAVACLPRLFALRALRTSSTPAQPGAGVDSDFNYFAFAKWLIDQHGAGARREAIRLMQDAEHEADTLAATDWYAVFQAIAVLDNDTPATTH